MTFLSILLLNIDEYQGTGMSLEPDAPRDGKADRAWNQ